MACNPQEEDQVQILGHDVKVCLLNDVLCKLKPLEESRLAESVVALKLCEVVKI